MRMKVFTVLLPAICLAGAPAMADSDYSEIAGEWYTEEIMMEVTEEGRFILGYNDGDWTGSLEQELRTNEEGDEYAVYKMILDDPEESSAESHELVPDIYHPGKITYYRDEYPLEQFYNVPVYVKDMGEEEDELEYYEPYYKVSTAEDEDEPVVTVMFTFLRPVRDVGVMVMFDQEFDEDGNLGYNADALGWWAELDSQEHIVVKHVFRGDLPDLSVSFLAEDGTRYDLAVEISGKSGQLILVPLLPSNG